MRLNTDTLNQTRSYLLLSPVHSAQHLDIKNCSKGKMTILTLTCTALNAHLTAVLSPRRRNL